MPCKRTLLLTGTPVQNNTDELFSLLNFIEPKHFPSAQNFKDEFGDLTSAEQIESLNKLLKPFILRRQKEDVEQQIPPLQETIIDIEMTTI
jgi:chromodomain-helicase-DNA-binding protein 7